MTTKIQEVIPIARAESPDYPCGVCAPCEWLPAHWKIAEKSMTKEQMELVAAARIVVVMKFRAPGAGGFSRPDSPGDPWYNPDEWDDQGNYYGPPKPMMPTPIQKGAPNPIQDPDSEDPDSSQTDSAKAVAIEMLKQGETFKAIATATGLKTGAIQRLKAKLKLSD